MIPEVDGALSNLLRSGVLPGGEVEISFEPPTRDWAAGRNVPTVNAYLYDIREDSQRRKYGMIGVRDESGVVLRRRRPLRYFRLSYLVTCWTRRPEDEHRLLASALGCVTGTEVLTISGDGPLAALGEPVVIALGESPADSRSAADLWSALGGNLKPSLDVTVVAPYPAESGEPVAPPVTETGVVARRLDTGEADGPVRLRAAEPSRGEPQERRGQLSGKTRS
ncbi:MAG TPA: DUF4255 domain-containing protein [Trebonia sp.]|nr:DUF4255 domain-containing protein [Trebonia sp.]